ncbi:MULTISPECIES: hypothetical protein [Leeuwenhoekiella]|jgi:hypothetical protein|uniref:Peptide methionine sulfoxide reductase n=1 Tax=Leeuwenhoekiella blandensis (strain CECT 7118 / CCUG 51940 / KCTC 22103 / MED217) TaxID=398720 RepID=A3XP22_LEEBM|nr:MULTISPECIES: hypothetical protein [Leeuwenhoekiella]EAQ48696.1 hypothetical protein MED217_09115 [Leeuwenhoekiella blandensis MED217]MAO45103.1 peptide methionine sulfoxide reductase [Leeuwenhoekiella sp.]HBT10603.1 peptide methionine sulfoxide reductase [Leeuwenhoekiella sp.]|tara:strand:- start:8523 stop:8777 length:255 start_codon:yes stop_codon:yes gene_type:complete
MIQLLNKILPGYSYGIYHGKKYGITRSDFNNGKSTKIYAEELAGTDFVSLNVYVTNTEILLKPCEMPEEKVLDFLQNVSIINDE